MHVSRQRVVVAVLMAAWVLGAAGCATGEADREMIDVSRVATYSEKADYRRPRKAPAGPYLTGDPFDPRCRSYRETIDRLDTATAVAQGVGALGALVELIADDDTARGIAGLAGVAALLSTATTSTAAEITAQHAAEKGCWLP